MFHRLVEEIGDDIMQVKEQEISTNQEKPGFQPMAIGRLW